ncbi:MAG: lipoyl(octanoyl) transferase LipB [Cyclobacteriaceae bacterium]|nr:lipoyl(octanoyl) transferase LipB [Cyclobacteriaceae bacterium]
MNGIVNKSVRFVDLGVIDYQEAWDYQTRLFDSTLAVKRKNREQPEQEPTANYLIFCEHPHVYTLGKSGDEGNLLVSREKLPDIQATYYHINRGGDITYHGPGQLVVYPVFDLENYFTDIHRYMRLLEEAVIVVLNRFQITAGRLKGLTGVWLDPDDAVRARKICAMGVKTSRWVTMHGLALNVNTDLSYFGNIVPCGIQDKAVTSIANELRQPQDMALVKDYMKSALSEIFEFEYN